MRNASDSALAPEGAADCTISVVSQQDYAGWQAAQPACSRQWLRDQAFVPEPGRWLMLPDARGQLASVVCIRRDAPDPFQLAALALKLPPKRYALSQETTPDDVERWSLGWCLAQYRFERYSQTDSAPERGHAKLSVPESVRSTTSRAVDATFLVRDLINTPAADMMPEHLSEAAQQVASAHGAEFRESVGERLLADNYPAIHAVGRASAHPPRLIELVWGERDHPELALVGKGVCFDSGGLDLKSAENMRLMKKDMGGAAHALGLAKWVLSERLQVRVRLLVPAVENAVSQNSYHPGDILRTRKGTTIEIHNTDAEGRVVLCDALYEAASAKPDLLLDFATLTGAARIALGPTLPALFCNHDALAAGLLKAGAEQGDPLWQMPLHEPYTDMLKSEVADLSNAATDRKAGAITAALYLQHFVEEVPWAHLDIMGWISDAKPGRPKGGEAMGLRAVFHYLKRRYTGA